MEAKASVELAGRFFLKSPRPYQAPSAARGTSLAFRHSTRFQSANHFFAPNLKGSGGLLSRLTLGQKGGMGSSLCNWGSG